jgi:hypothetical protein
MKSKIALWNLEVNENATQTAVLNISLKGGDSMLKQPLPAKWWERHFRGFEAHLPKELMCDIMNQLNVENSVVDEKTVADQAIRSKNMETMLI